MEFFFEKESKRAKSEIAMRKSNLSDWPTRAVVGGERRRFLYRPLRPEPTVFVGLLRHLKHS
jgi:hypothetical protein